MAAQAGRVAAGSPPRDRERIRIPRRAGLAHGLVQALDSLPHGLCVFDAADRLVFVSAGFRRLFGAGSDRVRPGRHSRAVLGGQDPADLWTALRRLRARGAADPTVRTLPDGREVSITLHPQADGGWAVLCEDVTERRRAEAALRYRAHHDPLTGLPNRYLFIARLDRALASPEDGGCALLCIDLDGFKPVNDRYGHAAGDALLQHLAERLRAKLGARGSAARIGGDEFAVLVHDADAALAFAGRLHERLTAPSTLGAGQTVRIGAAIGLACAPLHATRAQTLLERADTAMYAAKRVGRPCLWDAGMLFGAATAPAEADLSGT